MKYVIIKVKVSSKKVEVTLGVPSALKCITFLILFLCALFLALSPQTSMPAVQNPFPPILGGIPVDAKATYARQRRGITRPGDVGLGLRLETSDYTNYDKHLSIIGHGAAINAGSELESGPEFQLPNDCDY